ncbi:MAG: hypothetical protein WCN98_06785, partial [Verrucomicrobiaceae bacterium]
DSTEKRIETDERILALLSGEPVTRAAPAVSTEFKLPSIFTGGFGSDTPPDKRPVVAGRVLEYALTQAAVVSMKEHPVHVPAALSQLWLIGGLEETWSDFRQNLPAVSPERMLRAAWWCHRSDQTVLAYTVVWDLIFDSNGQRVTASLDVEKLLFDIALADKNTFLAIRQLRLLSEIDPGNRTAHQLRLAEQEMAREGGAGRGDALVILESLAKGEPQNEAVLSALAQCYKLDGRRDQALALWEKAVHGAKNPPEPLLEHYSEALIALHRFKEFIETHARLIEGETDLQRRRENFQRALERLMWADSLQGELADDEKKKRLDLVAVVLKEHSLRHPLDGFWFEAIARVYERQGDSAKAFAAMKQAYYTAPDAPFSLNELRAAALRAGDLKSSIYFQKKIATGAAAKDEAAEWRELVQLLEQDFRIAEADQVRCRLETRFSQNPEALEDLAKFYSDTSQEDSLRRVLGQIARVRPWDARNLLRLALAEKRTGDPKLAAKTLVQLLSTTQAAEGPPNTPVERWPWPLLDRNMMAAGSRMSLMNALDNTPGIELTERDRLRVFLSLPRGESAELPDETGLVRLRAIEELAAITGSPGFPIRLHSEIERAWALHYGGDGAELRKQIAVRFHDANSVEAQFVFVWLSLRSHGMKEMISWARADKITEAQRNSRKGLVQSVVNILAEIPGFAFTAADVEILGGARFLSNTELIDITHRLETRQCHDLAMLLGAAAKRNSPSLDAEYGIFLAHLAEAGGDIEAQRRYLLDGWNKPLQAGQPAINDLFMQSFARLLRLVHDGAEREQLLTEGWRRLKQLPPSGQGRLREARLLGMAGADDAADRKLAEYLGNGFITARAFVEPIIGRMPSGMQTGPRVDEVNHLRGYWEELREWGEVLKQDGLAPLINAADKSVSRRNGGVSAGPRANYEFSMWRNNFLSRDWRAASYPERMLSVRELAASNDSVDALMEAGNFLESLGFARECIEIYRRLPDRAPSNVEYCEQLLRASDVAWDYEVAIPMIEKLLVATPDMRPQNLPERLLEEKHAKFLARLHDTTKLRFKAFGTAAAFKSGRVPEAAPYLRELALTLEREGDRPGALAAWDQLALLLPEDTDAALHRAKIFTAQGHPELALEGLRKLSTVSLFNDNARAILELQAKLEADAGHWDHLRDMMNNAIGSAGISGAAPLIHVGNVITLARVLADHQRMAEAGSLLVRAERSVKDDTGRFRLRLEQIKLAAQDPAWSPQLDAARITSLFRIETTNGDALNNLREWMTRESSSPHARAWSELLPDIAPAPSAVLALAALGAPQDAIQSAIQGVRWNLHDARQTPVRRLIAETLIVRGQPLIARELLTDDGPPVV